MVPHVSGRPIDCERSRCKQALDPQSKTCWAMESRQCWQSIQHSWCICWWKAFYTETILHSNWNTQVQWEIMNRGFSIWIFPGWWYVGLGILNESHAFQPNIILQVSLWVAFRDKCTPSPSVVKPMISWTTSQINRDKCSLPVRLGELPGRSLSFGTILPLYPPKTYSELLKTCWTGTGTAAGGNLLVSYLWILGENLLSQNLHQGFGENQCNNAYLSSVTLPGAGWILYFVVVPPLLV